eukprot:657115-Pelagomonas_calceolata.AAC.3
MPCKALSRSGSAALALRLERACAFGALQNTTTVSGHETKFGPPRELCSEKGPGVSSAYNQA